MRPLYCMLGCGLRLHTARCKLQVAISPDAQYCISNWAAVLCSLRGMRSCSRGGGDIGAPVLSVKI